MRVSQFNSIDQYTQAIGLSTIKMDRLGKFVAIAGKNGAGKSRLLNLLRDQIHRHMSVIQHLPTLNTQIQDYDNAIKNTPESPHVPAWKSESEKLSLQIQQTKSIIFDGSASSSSYVVDFVPRSTDLSDPENDRGYEIKSKSEQTKNPGITNIERNALSYVKNLQTEWRNVTHQDYTPEDPNEVDVVVTSYKKLCEIFQELLGTEIKYRRDGTCTIFGHPIGNASLSDGQKILIQLAVAIHAQGASLKDIVLLLDEPENHLHPSVVVDIFDRLSQVVTEGQLWISTHSVPLLAHIASVDPMAIWYMDDGQIKHAGKKPLEVLSGLLGNEIQIEKLRTFLSLPAELASANFAAESLRAPTTVDKTTNDPQIIQINEFLNKLRTGTAIKVLDFGAGKGRIIEGFAEIEELEGRAIQEHINYIAFDEYPNDSEACKKQIERFYGSSSNRYFNRIDDLYTHQNESTFDVIIMCNVLHEIPPSKWLALFSETGPIHRSLKSTGFLVIVEDLRIPVGEKAHENGFFVLDTPHIRTLFSIDPSDEENGYFSFSDARNDGRLKAHWIAKPLIKKISTESRKKAISNLMQSAKSSIQSLRQKEANYANGMLHGFWSQQLANCVLYLDEN